MQRRKLEGGARNTLSSCLDILPIDAGMLLLTSLVVTVFPKELVSSCSDAIPRATCLFGSPPRIWSLTPKGGRLLAERSS